MNAKIGAVMRKELRDYRRNKMVVGTMAVMPLVFFLLPLVSLAALTASSSADTIKGAVGSAELWLLILPLLLPPIVAGYAVVGERDQGTLEPVLTTPVRREELLLGKGLAAFVPTLSLAYVLYAIFLLIARLIAIHRVFHLVTEPAQLVALAVFAPLLAAFAIWVGIAISVRASDVRVAQQLSALAVLPVVGLLALFTFRVVSPTLTVAVAVAIILLVIDLAAWRVVSRMFDTERVLTRYGRS
jgi:ABC-type transport system involved in multi-copper enzyme maturation permease subunit